MESFIIKKILHKLPEEPSHDLAILALKYGVFPNISTFEDETLKINLFGKEFLNPIGLAAGFDKNAECINSLSKQGFGFIECGTVTLNSQIGNPKPRMFRLNKDEAMINRMGFNNHGIKKFIANANKSKCSLPLGINIGINKNTNHPIEDYANLAGMVKNICDYIVLNISSPNTPNLRDLHKPDLLNELLNNVISVVRDDNGNKKTSIVLKISPDVEEYYKQDIATLALSHNIDALIISNTTTSRLNLTSEKKVEFGGLSGKPLFDLSTKILREMYVLTNKKIPIIASGGVNDAITAYEKIKSGASLVQIYTAIVYHGFSLVNKIKKDLAELIKRDGFANLSEAVGQYFND